MNRSHFALLTLLMAVSLSAGTFVRKTDRIDLVQIPRIDITQSVRVADMQLSRNKTGRALGFWALRDQIIQPIHADSIAASYLRNISSVSAKFDIWHLTWAITNFYRSGSSEVKQALETAYEDALQRGAALNKSYVTKHLTDSVCYRGWYHRGGWLAAKRYLVVPGDNRFLQSVQGYRDGKR